MRLTPSEMKTPLCGAAAALVAGVLAGGAMQPHLDAGDRPSGPQMFADWAGDRSTGPFDPGTAFVSYPTQPPDYVMGTDWKRRMAWPDERPMVPAGPREARDHDPLSEEPSTLTQTTYDDPPAPPAAAYPSMRGPHPSVIDVPAAETSDGAPPISD